MKTARPILALACVLGLAAPAVANTCIQPSEETALQLRALQSRLMVGAIACQQQEAYNTFVRRHQGDLGGAYRTAEGHFRRAHGGQGQRRWNAMDTDIAGAQSQEHTRLGSFFCRDTTAFFQQVSSLSTGADLARFSVERNILQPYQQPVCTASAPARAARTAARPRR
jgi:hypothetical protein